MPALAPGNILVLGAKALSRAPTYGEELWFEKRTLHATFDLDCADAIVAKGFARRQCPTPAHWATFVFAGGVIAALTGKYIVPPSYPNTQMWVEWHHVVWDELWSASEENGTKLEREVLAVILRELMPRFVSGEPYFMSGHQTFFERVWSMRYPDTISKSVCNVRQESILRGQAAFRKLTPQQQASVQEVAKHIPLMLGLANHLIRTTHHW